MKKLLSLLLLILFLLIPSPSFGFLPPTAEVPLPDDTPYNATSWDGNVSAATKNAIRDKIETLGTGDITGITAGDAIRVDNGGTATPDVHVDFNENTTDLESTAIDPADVILYMDSDNADDMARGLISDLPFESADATILKEADVDDTPIDGATVAPVSSNRMYDHENDADQHPEYAKESVVGTSLNADDLELNGAVLQTAAEIPHTDVDETITGNWVLKLLRLSPTTSEPDDEAVFDFIRADNDTWNPLSVGGTVDYLMICTAAGSPGTYVGLIDETGKWLISSIGTPTLEGDEMDDTSSPHTVIEAELKNKKWSNAGAGAAKTYTMLEHTTQDDWFLTILCEDVQNIIIDPHANDTYTLNGTAAAQDENIVNEACTAGESIVLYSTEVGVYLESKYEDWKEDTP